MLFKKNSDMKNSREGLENKAEEISQKVGQDD